MRRALSAGLGSLAVHGLALLVLVARPPAPIPGSGAASTPAARSARVVAFDVVPRLPPEAVAARAEPAPRAEPGPAPRPRVAPRAPAASSAPRRGREGGPGGRTRSAEGRGPSIPRAPPGDEAVAAPAFGPAVDPTVDRAAEARPLDLRLPLAAPPGAPPPVAESWLDPVSGLGRSRPADAPSAARDVELRREGSALVARAGRMEARIDADGELELVERSSGPLAFDLTELLMSARGEDALAHHRRVLLEATREERRARADAACETRLQTSVLELERSLEAIWADPTRTPAERRRLIFELWDECAEEGSPAVLRASALARATIESFVRRRLPAGGPHAWPAAELALLDRHRLASRRFDPYRAVTSTAAGAP